MNFVFTGRCTYRDGSSAWSRSDMQRLVTQSGHRVHNTITRHTHYLVASRTDTRKAEAAERFGVAVITYDMFMTMMQNAIQSVPDREHAGPLRRIDFEIPPRHRHLTASDTGPNPCMEVHVGGRVTSKNRPVRTVAHGGPTRRKLDL